MGEQGLNENVKESFGKLSAKLDGGIQERFPGPREH